MYDKREEFKQIEATLLKDLRVACNRLDIPFIWVAPVYDDGNGTEYKVALDSNKEMKENIQYACDALTPGSMGIELKDDLIRDIIKVLNGYKVVTDYNPIVLKEGELGTASTLTENETSTSVKRDEDGGLYLEDDDKMTDEDSNAVTSVEESILSEMPKSLHQVINPVDENNDQIHIECNTFLPFIDSDFNDDTPAAN